MPNNADGARARYQARKAANLCVRCAAGLADTGEKIYCLECRERRDVEQQSAAKPTEEAADAAGSEQPSKVSNTETVEEAQDAQSSSHHVTIEEQ